MHTGNRAIATQNEAIAENRLILPLAKPRAKARNSK